MISPYSQCTEYYRHYKITVVSVPVGSDPSDGVTMTTYVYNPTVSSVDPILSSTTSYPPFDTMDDFNDTIHDAIVATYPDIDTRVGETPDITGSQPGAGVDLPDPIEQDLYDYGGLGGSIPVGTSPRSVGRGGTVVQTSPSPVDSGADTVTGKDLSGAPGYPQTTYPATKADKYATQPYGGTKYTASQPMKAQRPKDTNKTKKHRKGLGRNETVADVINLMARSLDSIDGKRSRYVDPQTGSWANESRNNTLERLIGLQTEQLPITELSQADKEVTFSRYVYELIRNKTSSAVIEGKGLVGKELALKYGEELAKYIDILDGDNIAAVRAAAMAKRNTGVEFVPHTLEQSIAVGELTQESLSGGKKKERTHSPDAFPDTQFNQVNFRGNIVPPLVFKEVYKPKLGISYEPPISWLDYLGDRRTRKRDNDAAKSILTLTQSASDMALADAYFAIVNAANFDIVDNKMRQQDRLEIYSARQHAGGSYFDLLINAKGLESDPNTVTLRRLVASFSATLLCMKAQCSECRHYKGESGSTSRESSPDGSATLNAALTCEFGYTDAGGKAKGPESFCSFSETSPANPAMEGIKYDLNEEISNKIRDARNAIEKDGSEAYLSLMKQYGTTSEVSSTPSDAAAASGTGQSTPTPPPSQPYTG